MCLGDYGEQSLEFSASPETIDRILEQRFDSSLEESTVQSDGEYHFSREISASFGFETEALRYNPTTNLAHDSWTGID